MNWEWVKVYYEGYAAKGVLGHANAGVGYYILSQQGDTATVAFRRAIDGALQHHMNHLSSDELKRVTEAYNRRNGIRDV